MVTRAKGAVFNTDGHLVFDTVAALKAALPTEELEGIVWLKGHTAAGDGGGGAFFYDATEARTNDNGGTVIDPTGLGTGDGCWIRIHDSAIGSLKWFGSDDTSTDNLVAKNASVTGMRVFINDTGMISRSGLYEYDNSATGGHDGVNNFYGWIRILDDNLIRDGDGQSAFKFENLIDGTVSSQDSCTVKQMEDHIADVLGSTERRHTLVGGQTVIDWGEDISEAHVFISGANVDNGKLLKNVDFTIAVDNQTMTLSQSYPDNTIIHLYLFLGSATPLPAGATLKTVTGTTYTLTNGDIDQAIHFTNAAGCTVSLPTTAGVSGASLLNNFVCLVYATTGDITFVLESAGGSEEIKEVNSPPQTKIMAGGWGAVLRDPTVDIYHLTGDTKL